MTRNPLQIIRPRDRASHHQLFALAEVARLSLAPDGTRLQRAYVETHRGRRVATHVRPLRNCPWALDDNRVALSEAPSLYGLSHEVAHVLRVGREGPPIPPGEWVPVDGDWLHVHPDNWRNVDDPAARLPGSASAPQDDSELF